MASVTLDPKFMNAVEKLDYRVTVGDMAGQLGLRVDQAEKQLLELAAETGGNFQVAETGDLVYVFPRNFQGIIRNKYFRLRLSEAGKQAWRVMFYLIRISVGVVLLLLIAAVVIAIVAAIVAIMMSGKTSDSDRNDSGRSSGGGGFTLPGFNIFYFPDFGRLFAPDYHRYDYDRRDDYRHRDSRDRGNYNRTNQHRTDRRQLSSSASTGKDLGFFEVFFSFLFGDGIPNIDLEERRWQAIAATIRNNGGAITAEMVAPYLDDLGDRDARDEESYIVPVLIRFDGKPEITPDNDIIYCFPQLQATAKTNKPQPVAAYLKEDLWQFSRASAGQLIMAGGLGVALFVLSLVLLGLLQSPELSSFPGIINLLPWAGIGYSAIYLLIPSIRYAWLQWRNSFIQARNLKRQNRAMVLNQPTKKLARKLAAAKQFAASTVITQDKLAYTTEEDLLDQSLPNSPS